MVENPSQNWLDSAYKSYVTDTEIRSSLSPRFKEKFNHYNDLGLIMETDFSSKQRRLTNPRTSCSIKICELVSSKQRNSMITKAGISKILETIKKSKTKEELGENSKKKCFSPTSLSKVNEFSSYIDSMCSKGSPRGKVKEINPMFHKRINEVIEKSKKLVESCKQFDKEVKNIYKKPKSKLNKLDKMKIEAAIKTIV